MDTCLTNDAPAGQGRARTSLAMSQGHTSSGFTPYTSLSPVLTFSEDSKNTTQRTGAMSVGHDEFASTVSIITHDWLALGTGTPRRSHADLSSIDRSLTSPSARHVDSRSDELVDEGRPAEVRRDMLPEGTTNVYTILGTIDAVNAQCDSASQIFATARSYVSSPRHIEALE
jgi:hypothetical protein